MSWMTCKAICFACRTFSGEAPKLREKPARVRPKLAEEPTL